MKKVFLLFALTSAMLLTSCGVGVESFTKVSDENKTVAIDEAKQKIRDCKYGEGINTSLTIVKSIVVDGTETKTTQTADYGIFRDRDHFIYHSDGYATDAGHVKETYISSAEGVHFYLEVSVNTPDITGSMKVYILSPEIPTESDKPSDEIWHKAMGDMLLTSSFSSDFLNETSRVSSVSKGDKGSYRIDVDFNDDVTTETSVVPSKITGDLIVDGDGKITEAKELIVGTLDSTSVNITNSTVVDYDYTLSKIPTDDYKVYTDLTAEEKATMQLLIAAVGVN